MRSCSPDSDSDSEEDRPTLRRFLQATKEPRMRCHIQTGASAFGTQHQQQPQQQQRVSGVQQPDTPACNNAGEQYGTRRVSGKTILDGRYRLPPRLCKTAGSTWFRGYHARRAQVEPPVFVYEVDISFTVSSSSTWVHNPITCLACLYVLKPASYLHGPYRIWPHLCTMLSLHEATQSIMSSMSSCQQGH